MRTPPRDPAASAGRRHHDLFCAAYAALMLADPREKCVAARRLREDFAHGVLTRTDGAAAARPVPAPGRPPQPRLVSPQALPRRGVGSAAGRRALAHSLAHIEFNAINLALDAVYRFRDLPDTYYADWLRVAAEESLHFELLRDYLARQGACYGDYPAHDGVWQAARRTEHDAAARMALVPRVLEARALDVTPGLIERLQRAGDRALAEVLARIYDDEVAHVRIGSRWFAYLCARAGVDARCAFRELLGTYHGGPIRGPLNEPARRAAGFTEPELCDLHELSAGEGGVLAKNPRRA